MAIILNGSHRAAILAYGLRPLDISSVILVSRKKSFFFHAVNAIFGKVLHIATEDTVLHLIATKCMPILLYGLDVCPLNVADKRSLDFVQN